MAIFEDKISIISIRLLMVCSRILRLFPGSLLGVCGDVLGMFWYYCIPIRRSVVLGNIQLAFGVSLTPDQVRRLARNNFRHYGRVLIELICSVSWNRNDYLQRIRYHGADRLREATASGKGAYLLTLHSGNWELAIGATAAVGIPLSAVVKKGTSQLFRSVQQSYRGRQGVELLSESGTSGEILSAISRGRLVAFVLDQFMGPPIGLPVKFFGHRAGTAASLALFTERREANVFLTYSYRDALGTLHMVFEQLQTPKGTSEPLGAKLFEKTQFYNDALEKVVRARPDQWMWLHRRWKAYKGQPRWSNAVLALVMGSALVLSVACSVRSTKGPTGIELPADQAINVPLFVDPKPNTVMGEPPADEALSKPVEKGVSRSAPQLKTRPVITVEKSKTQPVVEGIYFEKIPPEKLVFEVGERMEIDLTWMALPAGRAVLEVRKGAVFDGRLTRWLWGNVLSSRLVDTIYHLDNTIESFVDFEGYIPYKFLLHMVETHQNKETRVLFDHPNKKAYYWSKRLSQKWGDENLDRVDALVPKARDMFSALYYSRMLDYRLGSLETIGVFENGQNWEIELTPVANELVKSKAGVFQCWKLMLKMKLNNVLAQSGDIALWLSDDSKRYLVKFDAKVKIGSLIGMLTRIRDKT